MLKSKNHLPATVDHSRWYVFVAIFTHRWIMATILVAAGMLVMARLGIWQLNRLEQRRAANANLTHQLAMPPLLLNKDALPDDLTLLKNRKAMVQGTFDYSQQIILLLQNWTGAGTDSSAFFGSTQQPGIDLVTPLVMAGTNKAVLVNRGWIPQKEASPENLSRYNYPAGQITVNGYILLSETLSPARATAVAVQPAAGDFKRDWYRVDIEAIQAQMPYELLPIYVEQMPVPGEETAFPLRAEPVFDLSDGPHIGYAIQWFIFASILGVGYLFYVARHLRR